MPDSSTRMAGPIIFECRDSVAYLTLNRPQSGNAIDEALARCLLDAVRRAAGDATVRCVVVQGEGRMFCAGGDVKALHAAGEQRPALLRAILAHLHLAIAALAQMDRPVVTAVHGPAAGAGVALAAVGDIVLASPEAHFTMAYSRIGLTPDAGVTWLLPRLIGVRRAQELALTNRRVSALEAESMGLITRVVPPGELAASVDDLARQLVDSASGALGATKRLLRMSGCSGLQEMLDAECEQIACQGGTGESIEGFAAFAERRTPNFRGIAHGAGSDGIR